MAYIERDIFINNELIPLVKRLDLCHPKQKKGVLIAISKLRETPTADVVEVRHGEWLYHECVSSYDGAISGYSCSHCGVFVDEEEFENDKFHKKFCGNCGAKMDGKDGE